MIRILAGVRVAGPHGNCGPGDVDAVPDVLGQALIAQGKAEAVTVATGSVPLVETASIAPA